VRSLDTNVVLRLLLGDVPQQAEQVKQLLLQAKPGSFAVADGVLFEIVWVLSGPLYNLGRPLIAEMLLQLATMPQIRCDRRLIERVVPYYTRNAGVSFIDAWLAIQAELAGAAPLLTYDKKLAAALPSQVDLIK
jgi:uncharacterized protein